MRGFSELLIKPKTFRMFLNYIYVANANVHLIIHVLLDTGTPLIMLHCLYSVFLSQFVKVYNYV